MCLSHSVSTGTKRSSLQIYFNEEEERQLLSHSQLAQKITGPTVASSLSPPSRLALVAQFFLGESEISASCAAVALVKKGGRGVEYE